MVAPSETFAARDRSEVCFLLYPSQHSLFATLVKRTSFPLGFIRIISRPDRRSRGRQPGTQLRNGIAVRRAGRIKRPPKAITNARMPVGTRGPKREKLEMWELAWDCWHAGYWPSDAMWVISDEGVADVGVRRIGKLYDAFDKANLRIDDLPPEVQCELASPISVLLQRWRDAVRAPFVYSVACVSA